MRIIFNLISCGLGDNGGSKTIVNSANTLVELGHKVFVTDSMKNKHTWTPLEANHVIIKNVSDIPLADVAIATGFKTVDSTLLLPRYCGGIRAHWIRAWEHWQMSEEIIYEKVVKASTIKLVNSICLQNKLAKYSVDSHIIRPGYDFDQLFPINIRDNSKIILGALYREGVHGRRKRTEWIFDSVKKLKTSHNIELWMLGSENRPNNSLIDKYLQNPPIEIKNNFYNQVHIWLAPTMSEGLHLPPAEAMLTECPVVGTNAELSGMQDYLTHMKTGIVSQNNLKSFTESIDFLITSNLRDELGKNARKKILELGDRKENMIKMIKLFEELS